MSAKLARHVIGMRFPILVLHLGRPGFFPCRHTHCTSNLREQYAKELLKCFGSALKPVKTPPFAKHINNRLTIHGPKSCR